MRHLTFMIIGGAFATAACAATPADGPEAASAGGERQCFHADLATNFRTSDQQTIYVRAARNDVFELKASGFCRDLQAAHSLAIRSSIGGGSRICTGDWANVSVAAAGAGASQCRVLVTRKLTEAEVEALPARDRP